jgi:hypothetical protein
MAGGDIMPDHETSNVPNGPNSDERKVDRLFQHGLHEEGVFYNRLNFFLVFESFVFAVAVTGLGKEGPPIAITRFICIVGVIISGVWWYAQVNKLVLLKALEDRIEASCDEFKETIAVANKKRIFQVWSANGILAHVFPLLFVGAWLFLLHYLCCHYGR